MMEYEVIDNQEFIYTPPGIWAVKVMELQLELADLRTQVEHLRIDLEQERHERQMDKQMFASAQKGSEDETGKSKNFTPSKKTRALRKGGKQSGKVTSKFTPTRDAILQVYAQIHQESLRKAATHFGVSYTTIKNVLNGN